MDNSDYIIKLENISKSFLEGNVERKVLTDLSFAFKNGEINILLGKSGSGKSTLLNIFIFIDIPVAGEIYINGDRLSELTEHERTLFRRKNIGFIFQFYNLIPTLTVKENLLLPLELNELDSKVNIDSAYELLNFVGLSDRLDSYPDILSGGQQQRVAIARALVHDPAIILADEPTGNLDYETGQHIIDLLDRLIRQKNKTLIMATHSRDLIGMADRIMLLRNGKLQEQPKDSA